jgi:hypothetical protein
MDKTVLGQPSRLYDSRIRQLLSQICAQPDLHARLLNTLSLLEHIGSRKIALSHARADVAGDTLKHLAEETRHAWFFKRAAEGLAGRKLSFGAEDVLAGGHARLYMGRLEAFVARRVPRPLVYPYVTLIVELRALAFYKIYQDVLKSAGHALSLKGVLAEEDNHLRDIGGGLTASGEDLDSTLPPLIQFEDAKFGALLAGLERALTA